MSLPFRGRPITVLMYHSVNPRPDDYSVTPARFREHMTLVRRHYPVVALEEIRSVLPHAGDRRVVVTFDDAFSDFVEHAYPVLAELGIRATLFIPTGFVGRSNTWDSHLPNVTRKPIMDVGAIRRVCADGLLDLGSHTVDHVRMRPLPPSEMRVQAESSKRWLEDTFGNPITMFSYPYGQRADFSSTTAKVLADAGYETAVTTCWGTRNSLRELLALRRIFFTEQDAPGTVRAKIEGWYNWKALKERAAFVSRAGLRMIRARG